MSNILAVILIAFQLKMMAPLRQDILDKMHNGTQLSWEQTFFQHGSIEWW